MARVVVMNMAIAMAMVVVVAMAMVVGYGGFVGASRKTGKSGISYG